LFEGIENGYRRLSRNLLSDMGEDKPETGFEMVLCLVSITTKPIWINN
jgi:hypothetical protein